MLTSTARISDERGYSLIELLIVLSIIAVATAAVIFTIPPADGGIAAEQQRLASRVAAARDNAIILARPVAVELSAGGYRFLKRSEGQWVEMRDKPFRPSRWGGGLSADVGNGAAQRLVFDTSGTGNGQLSFALVGGKQRLALAIGPDGRVWGVEP